MGNYSRTYAFTNGTVAYGDQLVTELDALGSSVNNIVNAQISSGAAIADSKLATISSAGKVDGAAITLLTNLPSAAGVIPEANLPVHVVQMVNVQTGAYATGTTEMPGDDTIPQITEGDEYMTLAITPKSSTNKLKIDVVVVLSDGHAIRRLALFQDTTAGALASALDYRNTATYAGTVAFTHYMTAGTTSATTFRVRIGSISGGVIYFNGISGARVMGGSLASSITITEVKS